ncbi:xanthine dehydrogenase family protein subunit M [Bradyrhizobium sp. BRP22]|uniref:FAD binding domain-containing protein n=1 Tax=Bradyrhizobium sp. BRP22 TaxID=2793821 RepID=UPI001CD2F622|nr:xanthine dehydrogenase family protein subunit M [Bradyrhizobium sp. BRP22]MCA1457669.1 xanthine dehydrogenase family protein subunit M [Bradyrhizobium sp. BRP22]
MKAPAFSYVRAESVEHALELLSRHGNAAKILSGGQSLLPALNLRLAAPAVLIDIGRLDELRGIKLRDDVVTIGALTRHADLLTSEEISASLPLLRKAAAHVAHPAIRNRGTIGGNLAHADPASEFPACMLALDARMVIRGEGGERRVNARDFFRGIYETALEPHELLAAIEVPRPQPGSRTYFHEFVRRSGDYAMTGLAALAHVDGAQLGDLRLSYFAISDRPHLARATSHLVGVEITAERIAEAQAELDAELDPPDDQQASAAMRRHFARLLLFRCVADVLGRPELAMEAVR